MVAHTKGLWLVEIENFALKDILTLMIFENIQQIKLENLRKFLFIEVQEKQDIKSNS